jgi:hypothetical protein
MAKGAHSDVDWPKLLQKIGLQVQPLRVRLQPGMGLFQETKNLQEHKRASVKE